MNSFDLYWLNLNSFGTIYDQSSTFLPVIPSSYACMIRQRTVEAVFSG